MSTSLFNLIIPQAYQTYRVAALPAVQGVTPFLHHWRAISASSIPEIDRSRPGYGSSALRYLSEGHSGFMVMIGEEVAAMGWLYVNTTSSRVRLKGYFPLEPRSAYLHADWTHPDYRGQGLHSECIRWRQSQGNLVPACDQMLASIDPQNAPSIHNYRKAGFRHVDTMKVWPLAQMIRSFGRGARISS